MTLRNMTTNKLQKPLTPRSKPTRKAQEPLSAFDQWWGSLGSRWLNVTPEHYALAKAAWDAGVEDEKEAEYGRDLD